MRSLSISLVYVYYLRYWYGYWEVLRTNESIPVSRTTASTSASFSSSLLSLSSVSKISEERILLPLTTTLLYVILKVSSVGSCCVNLP